MFSEPSQVRQLFNIWHELSQARLRIQGLGKNIEIETKVTRIEFHLFFDKITCTFINKIISVIQFFGFQKCN